MKKIVLYMLIALPLMAEKPCPLCEVHRAYNKEHPGDFEYYEDYQKSIEGKEAPKKEEPTTLPNAP